jgi:DNA-binding response OmpR family regulator
MNILVVEDEKNIREGLVRILQDISEKIQVSEASDGGEALEVLKDKSFNLVITDMVMFPMDGLELISCIRKKDNNIIIFMFSGSLNMSETAIELGANSVFQKGTGDFKKMLDAVKVLLNQ